MNAGPHSVVQPAPWALHVFAPIHLQMTVFVKSQFPRAQKIAPFSAHETKTRSSKRRKRLSELALRLLPSSQFRTDLCSMFLKVWLTLDPRNDKRRRNLQARRTNGPIGRLIPWRQACTLRKTSKKVLYAHVCQPEGTVDPPRKASLQI